MRRARWTRCSTQEEQAATPTEELERTLKLANDVEEYVAKEKQAAKAAGEDQTKLEAALRALGPPPAPLPPGKL